MRHVGRGPIIAVLVALVLGVGVGGFVEHQRALDDSNTPGAAATSTTAATTDWFGSRASSACPALKSWSDAFADLIFSALPKPEPWPAKRTALLALSDTFTKAYENLLPLASPSGEAELQALITFQTQAHSAIKNVTSTAAFLQVAPDPTLQDRLRHDVVVILDGAQGCDNDHSATKSTGTTTVPKLVNFFGSKKASACPILTRWNDAFVLVVFSGSAPSQNPWTTTRATLLQQSSTISAAYRSLLPLARPEGKVELGNLSAFQVKLTSVLRKARSASEYGSGAPALSAKLRTDVEALLKVAKTCPKA